MIGVLYGTGIQGSDNKGYVRIERETFPDVPEFASDSRSVVQDSSEQ